MWDDSDVEGLLSAFPYLKEFGVSDKRLIYKFDFNGVRFVFSWTGKYDYRSPSSWDATRPAYEAQMQELKQWLDEAKAAGTRKVFIAFHAPAFCRAGMGPIPESQNPHKILASYAKDLDIVVFNGHVHTTELYEVDGVKYLLLGGGGAEQDPILPGRASIKVPTDYPPDLYWKGQPRTLSRIGGCEGLQPPRIDSAAHNGLTGSAKVRTESDSGLPSTLMLRSA